MNFDLSDEQRMLRDQARRFLDEKGSPDAARAILEGDDPFDRDLWTGMANLGWMATAIPEAYGGAGLSHEELCVIAEELGRAMAPTPFSSSIYLTAEAILLAGSEDQKQRYLPLLASGEKIGCVAVAEGVRRPGPADVSVRFENDVLNGEKLPVADGDVADFAIVLARTGGGDHDLSLVLADLDGVECTTVETVDPSRSHARIPFDGTPGELLGAAGDGWSVMERVFDRAAILFAFEQVGGAQACLDMATDYAKSRYAFGRPIGSLGRSRRSSISWRTCISRSNWRGRTPSTAPGRSPTTRPTCRRRRPPRGLPRSRPLRWRRRRISRPMAAWATPGRWTPSSTIAAPHCWHRPWAASAAGRTS
jgi:alkylation response protein AidB-like acyl-CoA dehydrogenase